MARTKDFDEEEVLNKAMNLFWDKGYAGTSMQDLVDGLGISRSSLYDTFGDKHSLFIRVLENYRQYAGKQMSELIANSPSAKATVRTMLENNINELIKDKQHKGCFLVNTSVEMAAHDPEVSAMLCDNDSQVEQYFYEAISKGQESGELSQQKDARALARFILNAIKGIRVTAKSVSDKKMFEDIISLTMSVMD